MIRVIFRTPRLLTRQALLTILCPLTSGKYSSERCDHCLIYMKKETFFLSIAALIVGLLVAGGIFYAFKFLTSPPPMEKRTITLDATPTPVSTNSDELMVTEPADESVTDSKSVKISGKTLPGSTVVVTSDTDEQVAEPAENGNFSLSTTVSEGVNIIQVISFLPSGEERRATRTVTYTTESF